MRYPSSTWFDSTKSGLDRFSQATGPSPNQFCADKNGFRNLQTKRFGGDLKHYEMFKVAP